MLLLLAVISPSAGYSEEISDTPAIVETRPETDETRYSPKTTSQAKKDHHLDEVVVTATRTEKSLADVPAAVSVVTKQDIESRNIQKVDEAINMVPGLFDKRSKGLDTTGRVTLRGLPDQRRTLVLLDGQPLNDGYTNQVNWNSISPQDIERIEVARGPFSSLYGGNAMGGVINIITRMPQEREYTFKGGYGSNNFWTTYGSYGDRLFDRLSLFASYGYSSSDGYPSDLVVSKPGTGTTGTPVTGAIPTTDNTGKPAYIIGDKGDNNWWTNSATFKLAYDLSQDSKAFFSFNRNEYSYGYADPHSFLNDSSGNPIFSGAVRFGGGRLSLREGAFLNGGGAKAQNIYNAGYQGNLFGDAILKVSGSMLDIGSNWYVTPTSSSATRSGGEGKVSDTPSQAYFSDIQLSLPVMEKHLITFGTAFRHDNVTNKEFNLTDWRDPDSKTTLAFEAQGKDVIYSVFTQAEIALLPFVTLYGGVRGNYWETYDGMANQVGSAGFPQFFDSKDAFSWNPKGSVVVRPLETTSLRGSVGTAFRPPNVYELYRTWVSSTGVTYQANPRLDPETSFSWDIGLDQKLGAATMFKITYFHNTIDDFIYTRTVSSTLNIQTNAGKAETEGIEAEVETKPRENVRLFSSYTFTKSKMLENPAKPSTEGKQLIGIPEHMYSIGGEVKYGKSAFTAVGRYVSKQYSNDENLDTASGVYTSYDPYFVADFYVRYELNKWATLNFAVNNILDKEYFSYYKAPGREFFGGVTVKF